jgi:predicted Zn finger-like uncharacterized protein
MKVACENCRTLFRIEDKDLSAKGATVICPKCQHPHLVKRIVIPYGNLKSKKSKNDNSPKKPPLQDDILKNSRTETFIKKVISRVNMSDDEESKNKYESIEYNPLIETLEHGITQNHMNKKLKKENKKKSKNESIKNAHSSEIIELESFPSFSGGNEESIISYSDAQKLGGKTIASEAPPKQLSTFFTILLIVLSFIGLIGFMIFAIYQKYSGM